jgi:hypothetical protein
MPRKNPLLEFLAPQRLARQVRWTEPPEWLSQEQQGELRQARMAMLGAIVRTEIRSRWPETELSRTQKDDDWVISTEAEKTLSELLGPKAMAADLQAIYAVLNDAVQEAYMTESRRRFLTGAAVVTAGVVVTGGAVAIASAMGYQPGDITKWLQGQEKEAQRNHPPKHR